MSTRIDELHERFVRAPGLARVPYGDFEVVWPAGGYAAAFDAAASTMLDCFDEPIEPGDLADDLVAALGMERRQAASVSTSFIASLLGSGHLLPEGNVPMPSSLLGYPPSASP